MTIGILGTKVGMTQVFDDSGFAIPVTVIKAGPCIITHIKNTEKEGYNAVQIGYSESLVRHETMAIYSILHVSGRKEILEAKNK